MIFTELFYISRIVNNLFGAYISYILYNKITYKIYFSFEPLSYRYNRRTIDVVVIHL